MKKIIIFIPLLLSFVVSVFINQDTSYIKPDFTPPDIVFPIVWSILYLLIGISYYISSKNDKIKKVYYTQLAINYLWSFLFFNFKLYLLSFLTIIVLIIIVLYMIYLFYQDNKISAYLNIPYLLWLLFACYLSYNVYLLN